MPETDWLRVERDHTEIVEALLWLRAGTLMLLGDKLTGCVSVSVALLRTNNAEPIGALSTTYRAAVARQISVAF